MTNLITGAVAFVVIAAMGYLIVRRSSYRFFYFTICVITPALFLACLFGQDVIALLIGKARTEAITGYYGPVNIPFMFTMTVLSIYNLPNGTRLRINPWHSGVFAILGFILLILMIIAYALSGIGGGMIG